MHLIDPTALDAFFTRMHTHVRSSSHRSAQQGLLNPGLGGKLTLAFLYWANLVTSYLLMLAVRETNRLSSHAPLVSHAPDDFDASVTSNTLFSRPLSFDLPDPAT